LLIVSCGKPLAKPNPVEFYDYLGDGEEVVLENEYLRLNFFPDTADIILTNKATGAQWFSNPPAHLHDANDDFNTQKLIESQVALEFSEKSRTGLPLFSSLHSVERGTYRFRVVDNVLEVSYTIGDVARPFRIPPAMTEEKMDYYLYQIEWENRQIVEMTYRLYDINNLRMNDNREKLLENYPDLERMKLWVLREDDAQDFMKEITEECFALAGYTIDDYIEDTLRYEQKDKKIEPVFSVTIRYALDGKSLVVDVPFDRIGYNSIYPITELTVLPFFGSADLNDEGYMFVPDGSGGLIYFNNGKHNQEQFEIPVYGWDDAMPRRAKLTDDKAPFPVFGIQKNNSTLLCIIENGSAYARIRADVSGRNCSWNRVFAVFDMVHGAVMDISGRNQREVYQYESSLPAGENLTLRYVLCDEPGYVGMAKEYRSWLVNKYPNLGRNIVTGNELPLVVEIVGAVNKTQHSFGLPMDRPLRLTSYDEMAGMINDFAGFGWKNVQIKLNGWFNRSVEHTVPTSIKLINELGSKRSFLNMLSEAEKNNFTVYPEVDFMFVRDVGMFSGFNLNSDAARYVNRERAQQYPFSFVWFGERTQWGKLSYLSRPGITMRMIDNFMKKAAEYNIQNIAFKNMGSRLAGDYHERRRVSREASMLMRQNKFEQLKQAGNRMLVNVGYNYSVPWASVITDMLIKDQDYGITDTSVPFYQIVLRGLVPYTGRAINLAEDYSMHLLKTIESGAGLYFSFKIEDTAILQETKFRQFYANEYGKWIGDARELYQRFVTDFGHLNNQAIINHVILSPGVTVTEYEDGTWVIVNASNNIWNYNNTNIDAGSYIVLRHGWR